MSRNGLARRTRTALLLATMLPSACGDPGPASRAVVRDSAGITIVENASPDDSTAYDWWTVANPEIDIGGDADATQALFRVVDAHRRSDGSVVVANSGSSELLVFDAAGAHRATWGRRGGGPGEFQSLAALLPGGADSLLVWDARERRFSLFDPDGDLARDFHLGESGSASATPVDRLADGGFVAWAAIIRPDPNEILAGLQRGESHVLRFTAAGAVQDTIGVFPGGERVIRVTMSNGEIQSIEVMMPPFARTTSHAMVGDDVWVATQDAPELRAFALDGALRRIVRTGRSVQAVTPRHIDAWIERSVQDVPGDVQQGMRERLQALPHGQSVPPYGRILSDDAGNAWVADYNDPLITPGRWTVYGDDGRAIARITLPERFVPYEIGADWILGRELDDLDVEHVRLYRISKRPSAGSS